MGTLTTEVIIDERGDARILADDDESDFAEDFDALELEDTFWDDQGNPCQDKDIVYRSTLPA